MLQNNAYVPFSLNGFKRNAHTFIGNCPASLEKKTVFANHAKTGAVTAHLMSATKVLGKSRILPSIVSVQPGLLPNWVEFRPKTCLLASGLNNDFFHICVNIGAGQLCVNRAARSADQRFCCRFIGSTLPINEISYI